ncbi:HU domain-containing protein [Sinomicrobium soli]|uniref:HU domain-containing protein n=1 Tax=Sinomicrobium sp. N-1-3-6 TaxID=2219864 RepID=UPI000DCE96D1|nr:SPOR domain-containing protein [Sinomicrobium sp. N-1-3-6]RAV29458.1 SPOR domain-containing protein [Sinomicrobium sp. N-1-3-6]
MQLEHYIGELLYRYSCVTVPEFGSFLTQLRSARIHNHTFFPPSKAISFNAQLVSNDGLLIRHISDSLGIPYEKASVEVRKRVIAWKDRMENGEKLSLKQIGLLWLNKENSIQFQPFTDINYLTSSFGMASTGAREIARLPIPEGTGSPSAEVRTLTGIPSRRKSYLKYAAILLLSVSAGAVVYQSQRMESQKQQIQLAEQQAQQQLQQSIQKATFFDTTPVNLPSITLNATRKPLYYVVAGAFRVEENADKKMEELRARGYEPQRLEPTGHGLHQVAFNSYTSAREAINFLNRIKKEAPEAWLLVSEN